MAKIKAKKYFKGIFQVKMFLKCQKIGAKFDFFPLNLVKKYMYCLFLMYILLFFMFLTYLLNICALRDNEKVKLAIHNKLRCKTPSHRIQGQFCRSDLLSVDATTTDPVTC